MIIDFVQYHTGVVHVRTRIDADHTRSVGGCTGTVGRGTVRVHYIPPYEYNKQYRGPSRAR